MEWCPWLRYFEVICVEENNNDVWKICQIQIYLKDSALNLYTNKYLHILHWPELTELFLWNKSIPGSS